MTLAEKPGFFVRNVTENIMPRQLGLLQLVSGRAFLCQ